MDKPVLYFYTNMPTPYQLDFFDALSDWFSLTVIYFTARENNRQWQLPVESAKYQTIVLRNNAVARTVQRYVTSFHFSNRIAAIAAESVADMVIVNGTYWSPNVLLALRNSKKVCSRVAWWGEPVFPSGNPLKKSFKAIFLSAVFRNTHMLLAIGKKAVECYRAFGYSKPIYNIPYNIDNSLFQPGGTEDAIMADLLRKYKSKGELVFLSSGALVQRKGMDTIIKAFSLLPAQYNAVLLILGDGPDKEALQELAGNDHRIQFLGFQEKAMVPSWFKLCDVFVFASRYDGWALVINEAMAAGKAIICSYETGAAYDSLVNRNNALLYNAEDIQGFAAGMHEMAADEPFRQQLATNAALTGNVISSSNMAKKIYDVLRVGQ